MKLINRIRKSYLTFAILFVSVLFLSTTAKSNIINIGVSSNSFTPNNVSANVGDTIKWNWVDGFHTTTCDGTLGTSFPPGASSWNSPIDNSSPSYTYAIAVSGIYNYVCTFHAPGMAGTITVGSGGLNSYLDENFDYPTGDTLGDHGWNSFSGSGINALAATNPGLEYTGYPLSAIGNATTVNISGQDAYKNFAQSDSSGSFYATFMLNGISAQTGDYFLAFLPNNSTTFYSGRVQARVSGTNFNLGISKGASTDVTVWGTENYTFGTTYLVVLKFTFVAGTTNDEVSLYVFSSGIPAAEPTATIGPSTFPSGDPGNIGRIALRQGTAASAPSLRVDGIRVTKSWTNIVTGIGNNTVSSVPESFSLAQNYPNPFNPTTTIKFSLPEKGFVNLAVYNSLGKEVSNLVNENMEAGTFSSQFDGTGLSSGVYFYKLSYTNQNGNNFIDTKRLLLVK
ncbi:MAG: T9SS type A sorting domain-containing protein [Ignavibacteria bacterium]